MSSHSKVNQAILFVVRLMIYYWMLIRKISSLLRRLLQACGEIELLPLLIGVCVYIRFRVIMKGGDERGII